MVSGLMGQGKGDLTFDAAGSKRAGFRDERDAYFCTRMWTRSMFADLQTMS